nr:hypothetical protein CFP56_75850 [Quercus suber]
MLQLSLWPSAFLGKLNSLQLMSFHVLISLYQCSKPQVALGSNAIVSLNFILVILDFQYSVHVLQQRVVQDSPCSKYEEKLLVPILS